jgi:hypothetical protein
MSCEMLAINKRASLSTLPAALLQFHKTSCNCWGQLVFKKIPWPLGCSILREFYFWLIFYFQPDHCNIRLITYINLYILHKILTWSPESSSFFFILAYYYLHQCMYSTFYLYQSTIVNILHISFTWKEMSMLPAFFASILQISQKSFGFNICGAYTWQSSASPLTCIVFHIHVTNSKKNGPCNTSLYQFREHAHICMYVLQNIFLRIFWVSRSVSRKKILKP